MSSQRKVRRTDGTRMNGKRMNDCLSMDNNKKPIPPFTTATMSGTRIPSKLNALRAAVTCYLPGLYCMQAKVKVYLT